MRKMWGGGSRHPTAQARWVLDTTCSTPMDSTPSCHAALGHHGQRRRCVAHEPLLIEGRTNSRNACGGLATTTPKFDITFGRNQASLARLSLGRIRPKFDRHRASSVKFGPDSTFGRSRSETLGVTWGLGRPRGTCAALDRNGVSDGTTNKKEKRDTPSDGARASDEPAPLTENAITRRASRPDLRQVVAGVAQTCARMSQAVFAGRPTARELANKFGIFAISRNRGFSGPGRLGSP